MNKKLVVCLILGLILGLFVSPDRYWFTNALMGLLAGFLIWKFGLPFLTRLWKGRQKGVQSVWWLTKVAIALALLVGTATLGIKLMDFWSPTFLTFDIPQDAMEWEPISNTAEKFSELTHFTSEDRAGLHSKSLTGAIGNLITGLFKLIIGVVLYGLLFILLLLGFVLFWIWNFIHLPLIGLVGGIYAWVLLRRLWLKKFAKKPATAAASA